MCRSAFRSHRRHAGNRLSACLCGHRHQLRALLRLLEVETNFLRRRIQRTSTHLHTWATQARSEEHTSELQSLMRKSYAVFCLKKNNKYNKNNNNKHYTEKRKEQNK